MKFIAFVVAIAFVAIVESKPQAQKTANGDTLRSRVEGLVGPLKELQTVLEGVAAPVFEPILNNVTELIGEIESQAKSVPSSSLSVEDVQKIVNPLESKISGLIGQVDSNWDSLPSDEIKIKVNDAKFNLSTALTLVTNVLKALYLEGFVPY